LAKKETKKTSKKKAEEKKSVTKKAAPKKPTIKKVAEKKPTVKKATVKKAPANKPTIKKVTSKKVIDNKSKIKKSQAISISKGKRKMRYTAKELEYFKEILLEERRQILESAMANMKSLVDSESGEYVGDNLTYASHMAEQGSDEMEREKNYMFVQRDEKYLGYLQEALARIELGTYGVCIDCAEEPKLLCKTCPLIPKERLELVPITQHCIECKNLRG
jgi:RNA polymerase-binding transcription factor DksA